MPVAHTLRLNNLWSNGRHWFDGSLALSIFKLFISSLGFFFNFRLQRAQYLSISIFWQSRCQSLRYRDIDVFEPLHSGSETNQVIDIQLWLHCSGFLLYMTNSCCHTHRSLAKPSFEVQAFLEPKIEFDAGVFSPSFWHKIITW